MAETPAVAPGPGGRCADLSRARILVTNDDGIHAPGLKVLERIARRLSRHVWVVAPESEQSAVAHSLTLRRPLRLRKLGRRRFSLDGTPTDCVLIARHAVMKDAPPDLVLSGINHGANLGEDVTYSGTVAAAMEAALLGLPAIALSQVRSGTQAISWAAAEHFAPAIIAKLAPFDWPRDVLINVNFPNLPPEAIAGIKICPQGRREGGITLTEGVDPGGRPYLWIGDFLSDDSVEPDSDLAAIVDGVISVTPLHLDLTHQATLERLSGSFA